MKSYLSYMSIRGTAIGINICMVLKQQISPTLENTYPPQTPIGLDTACIPDDNCRHTLQTDACPVGLTLGEVECRAEGSAAFCYIICIGVVVLMWQTSLTKSHPPTNTHWASHHLQTR